VKVASYNLQSGGKRQFNPWKKLLSTFEPDFVFAQESRHPHEYFESEEFSTFQSCVHANVATHRRWGSAILARHSRLEQVPVVPAEFDGWVIGAIARDQVIGAACRDVLLVSLHAPSLGEKYERYVEAIILEIAKMRHDMPLILAGDFNLTTAVSRPGSALGANAAGEKRILALLRDELNAVNTWQHLHPDQELPQTLRWSGNKTMPYHCDAIFADVGFLPFLSQASVVSDADWTALSDHNPVLAIFEQEIPTGRLLHSRPS
jgi:endonuclease/exonuclease/phosphatase family metal-dependent hydrolase